MSDCRFGVSPVNYPDPDPDAQGRHVNFAWDPLRSYSDDLQKNEIHLSYVHFVFTSVSFIICENFINILQSKRKETLLTDAFGYYVQQPSV